MSETKVVSFINQNKPLATLSLQGWVRDVGKQIDMAIAYTFVSNASQSYIFSDRILSVQKLIHDYTGNIPGLCNELQNRLEQYLRSLFDEATVEVSSNEATVTGQAVSLYVYATVTVNGKEYNTAAGVDVKDSCILRFFDLNNSGPSY